MSFFDTPRGERNNNPFNIDYSNKNDWDGQIGIEPSVNGGSRFSAFISPTFGARAFFKLLQTYKEKHKVDTVSKLIDRFAPPSENPTKSYAKFVADKLGVGVDDKIDLTNENVAKLIAQAKVRFENGKDVFDVISAEELNRAYALATGAKYTKEEKADSVSRKKGELSDKMITNILIGSKQGSIKPIPNPVSEENVAPRASQVPSSAFSEEEERVIQHMMNLEQDVQVYSDDEERIISSLVEKELASK